MKVFFKFIALLVLAIFLIMAWILITTPDANSIKACITTKMYKVSLCEQDSNYVFIDRISPLVKNLVLIAEDVSFYGHKGFDWDEMNKSFRLNFSELRLARGGSTITQQLAKNVFLTFDKSLFRKMREAIIAHEIEKIIPKNKIFEKYLNVIELGNNIFGIKNASRHYFSKEPEQLNLLESAFITYLIPNPKMYSRVFNTKKLTPYAKYRILDLCYRMYRFNKASEAEYLQAKAYIDQFPWSNMPSIRSLPLEHSLNGFEDPLNLDSHLREDLPESDSTLDYIAPPDDSSSREKDSPFDTQTAREHKIDDEIQDTTRDSDATRDTDSGTVRDTDSDGSTPEETIKDQPFNN